MRISSRLVCVSALAGGSVLISAGSAPARVIPPGSVEQIQDLYVHTVTGTSGTSNLLKGGKNFDGGEAAALLKWDLSVGFPNPLAKVIGDMGRSGGDGSFSVHQMLTSWTESTAFGTTWPVAGVDYLREPVAAFGFNETKAADKFDLTRLFQHWQANPATNNGLILIPRGQLNGAYSGTFDNEVFLAAQERVPASIDGDDQWATPTGGASTHVANVIKPLEDTAVQKAAPNSSFYSDFSNIGIDDRTASRQLPLLKFGFGELMFDGVDRSGGGYEFTQADLELHAGTGGQSVTFNVHKMLTNWDETTATWNQFGASGPQAGTDYDNTIVGTATLGGIIGSTTIDIKDLASEWLADPSTNYGLILVPTSTNTMTDNLGLFSSERVLGGLDSDDPRLIVEMALVPEPSLGIGVLTLLASGLLRRRTCGAG